LSALALGGFGCEALGIRYEPGAESILDFKVGPDYSEAAQMAINEYDADDRYQGTLILAGAPFAAGDPYIRLFEENARDEDASVRAASIRGLANHGSPDHVPLIAAALDDESEIVRMEAARGLQRIHGSAAISPLMSHTRESVEPLQEIRAEAAHALGQYAEPRVLQELIRAIREDPSLAVNASALEAMQTLTGKDFGLDHNAWTRWLATTEDPFAGRSLYYFRTYQRDPTLIERLPFIPGPPNDAPAPPAGLPPDERASLLSRTEPPSDGSPDGS
jgi:hypothetical protein